jgi:hypothetical protein
MVGLDVGVLRALVRDKRGDIRAILAKEGVTGYREDFALAIFLYTVETPALYAAIFPRARAPRKMAEHGPMLTGAGLVVGCRYKAVNGALRAKDRAVGGTLSDALRACMPFVRFLHQALISAPAKFVFEGRCHRGVQVCETNFLVTVVCPHSHRVRRAVGLPFTRCARPGGVLLRRQGVLVARVQEHLRRLRYHV